jgi:hypothetical protein
MKYTFETVKTAKDVGVTYMHARCMHIAKKCKAETPGKCPALAPCQADRHKIEQGAIAINRLIAAVLLGIAIEDEATAKVNLLRVGVQVKKLYDLLKKLKVM